MTEPDVVNLKEIHERLGVAYVTAQKWYREHKLPEPLKTFGGRNPIWVWDVIIQWCYDTERDELVDNARRGGWL